jgi:hypothetical protein
MGREAHSMQGHLPLQVHQVNRQGHLEEEEYLKEQAYIEDQEK